MHSAAPYLFRSFNKIADKAQPYSELNKVGQYDTFHLLKSYIEANTTNFAIIEETKQVLKFSDMQFKEEERLIYGWLNAGKYGVKSNIIDIETGKVSFEKLKNNADVFSHFIYLYIPKGCRQAIALFHSYAGNGAKTLFHDLFNTYFQKYTNQVFQMNPLSYEKAFDHWMEANAKEIRLTRFVGFADLADQIKLGHDEQILIYKPARKSTLGRFKDYFNKETDEYKAVEVLSGLCEQVKMQVELGGKKRVFNVGTKSSNTVCEIDIPEETINQDGIPDYDKITLWCSEITSEFSKKLFIVPKVD